MRRIALLTLCLLVTASALAQQRKMKLDSLGLPPYPGASNVGHISLPLKDILKPKPGQHPTGPNLTDLAIQTYRTPMTVPVERIAAFYLKYAQQLGWRLLDDIPDSATTRSLVFWSPAAPGYLTVEVVGGPDNTRQIDLTRLLGDVNPARPGEVVRLTGKRIREQHVEITYVGRFSDVKTGKVTRQTLKAIEERSEGGLPTTAVVRLPPMDESYAIIVKLSDSTKRMLSADAFTANNVLVAHAESAVPTGSLTMLGKVRATQGLTLRVMAMGTQEAPAAPAPKAVSPAPAKPAAAKTAKPAARAKGTSSVAKAPAPAKPAPVVPAPAPAPPRTPVVLSEWYGMRPPLTAVIDLRRGPSTTQNDSKVIAKDVEAGSTCEERQTRTVEWKSESVDKFSFSPDLFGPTFPRTTVGARTGSTVIEFPLKSGTSNKYTLTEANTTTTTEVSLGWSFNGQWITLPAKRENPVKTTYVVTSRSAPTVTKQSSGPCPPAQPAVKATP